MQDPPGALLARPWSDQQLRRTQSFNRNSPNPATAFSWPLFRRQRHLMGEGKLPSRRYSSVKEEAQSHTARQGYLLLFQGLIFHRPFNRQGPSSHKRSHGFSKKPCAPRGANASCAWPGTACPERHRSAAAFPTARSGHKSCSAFHSDTVPRQHGDRRRLIRGCVGLRPFPPGQGQDPLLSPRQKT